MPVEGRHLKREYALGSLRVWPLTPLIGATLDGVDLSRPVAADVRAAISEALRRHRVIFFHGQHVPAARFVEFGRSFGRLQTYVELPGVAPRQHPELHRFEYSSSERGREAFWHFDVLADGTPARATLLKAEVVPEVGGDTLFCDLCAVHESLPASLRERLEGALGLYDQVFERRLARFRGRPEDELLALSRAPLQEFPLVLTRPSDGAKSLFVNPSFLIGISGLEPAEAAEIASDLRARIARPEFQCRFRWRAGDVAFWDNHTCLHYATNNYVPERRVMERLSLATFADDAGASSAAPADDAASPGSSR